MWVEIWISVITLTHSATPLTWLWRCKSHKQPEINLKPSVASLRLLVGLRVASLSLLSRGFSLSLTHRRAHAFRRSLFGHTLSERRGGSTPHGFAYCKSSREWRVGSPAGQHLSFFSSRPLSVVWSHLQWLANCSYPNGRRPSPSLHLFAHT